MSYDRIAEESRITKRVRRRCMLAPTWLSRVDATLTVAVSATAYRAALVLEGQRVGMERSSASSLSSMPMTGKCSLGMRWPAPASAARWCAI
jgi:hypothetical protein